MVVSECLLPVITFLGMVTFIWETTGELFSGFSLGLIVELVD